MSWRPHPLHMKCASVIPTSLKAHSEFQLDSGQYPAVQTLPHISHGWEAWAVKCPDWWSNVQFLPWVRRADSCGAPASSTPSLWFCAGDKLFPRQQCLISGSSRGALFYCLSTNVEQLTAHCGPWQERVERPGKRGLSFTPLPIPKPQPPRLRCNASLTALCSINCQQREKADTNKGDLAQRDAERLLSLVRSGDQSRDLTERDSWPLVPWQRRYW